MRQGRIGDYITGKSVLVDVRKGDQPDYTRAPATRATSKELLAFRRCVQEKLIGKKPGSRAAARRNFASAAKSCSVKKGE